MKSPQHPLTTGILLTLATATLLNADPLDQWQWRNPLPQGNAVGAAWYGNGIFLASGHPGTILISTNGQDWVQRRTAGASGGIAEILYAQGKYVAVGAAILTSTNAIDWVCPAPGLQEKNHIAYGNGVFVATGFYDDLATSPDGVTWTEHGVGLCCNLLLNIEDIAFGAGRFVIVGYPAATVISTDGISWSMVDGAPAARAITYGNGRFVAVGGGGTQAISTTGLTWTPAGVGTPYYLLDVVYGSGQFAAVGFETATGIPVVVSATDAVHWTRRSTPSVGALESLTYANNVFVAAGSDLTRSTNLVNWTYGMKGFLTSLSSVAAGPEGYVAVADSRTNKAVVISPDGVTWTELNLGANYALTRVVREEGQYTAVGYGGTILSSTNGQNWTRRTSGTTNDLFGVADGNGRSVVVGWHSGGRSPHGADISIGTVLASADGTNWEDRSATLWNTNVQLQAVTYGSGQFVAVGSLFQRFPDFERYVPLAMTSPDGLLWNPTLIGSENGYFHGVTHANGVFVVVGDGGTILTSFDALTWVARPTGLGFSLSFRNVTWGGGFFAACGTAGIVVTSPDSANWTVRNTQSDFLGDIAYQDGRFVAVGGHGIIMQSENVLPRLSGRALPDDGGFEIGIAGGAQRSYRLQAATGLPPVTWTDLLTFTNTAPATTFVDTNAANFNRRFYRVVSP